jgi:hypothetical protein
MEDCNKKQVLRREIRGQKGRLGGVTGKRGVTSPGRMHTHKLGVTPGRCARGRQRVRVYGREGSASAYVGPPSQVGAITSGR